MQQLADLSADAESRPRVAVPRLADHSLPDQLAVMVHDLDRIEAAPVRRRAGEILAELRAALFGHAAD